MELIDLRSDTVTQPTPAMREAMAKAEVGDDVYGDDPTVNRLQEMAAALMGKEAALFVASGSMGNLTSIMAHCQRGDEVIVGNKAHTFLYEAAGTYVLGGLHSRQIQNLRDGSFDLDEVRAAVRPDDAHFPPSRLLCLENTHNRCGGGFQTLDFTQRVADLVHGLGLRVHLDGARIFNAAAALGRSARELAGPADSVSFCLSKGLCAPVGSLVCGTQDLVKRAHRIRKMVGGGMRQAGVLAAAGIVALEQMTDRLGEDHARARLLADGLRRNPGLTLEPDVPATNLVYVNLADGVSLSARSVTAKLKELGVLVGATSERGFRLVTHYWIGDADVERALSAFEEVLH
jgi:threonine aldolase